MTDTDQQQKNTYKKLSTLHECLICNSKVSKSECVSLKNCQHCICHICFNKSMNPNLIKNIDKYPLQCPTQDCDKQLDSDDLKNILNETQIKLFNNINRFYNSPPKEREHCPKCEMWFKYFPKWHRIQSKPFEYIVDEERTECKECKIKFQRAIMKRHRCRICGEVLCDDCSSTKVPLTATPNQIISLWKQNRKSGDLEKSKQWFKGLAAVSTMKNVFPEDDDDKKLSHTESERVQIEHERVRCCYDCWLDYYCVKCKECKYKYCIKCRNEWHDNFDCEQQRRTSVQVTEIIENKQDNFSSQNNRNKVIIGASKSAPMIESEQAKNNVNQAISKVEERGQQLKQLDMKAENMANAASQFEALTREMARKTI
eukprot:431334_1